MDKQEMIKTLQTDVEIPKVVQDKAQEAFDKIKAMSREENHESWAENEGMKTENNGRKTGMAGIERETGEGTRETVEKRGKRRAEGRGKGDFR